MILLLVVLLDGSQVNLKVDGATPLVLKTKYGAMSIPLADVLDVSLGVHVDDQRAYKTSVTDLGDGDFKKRDAAMKFLRDNRRNSYPFLLEAKNSKDAEQHDRVAKLLKSYDVAPQVNDYAQLKEGSYVGVIQNATLEGESTSLGKLKIPISQITAIRATFAAKAVTLKHGQPWLEVGYVSNGKVKIRAAGQIDMWPSSPGTWVSTPKGLSNGGNGLPNGYPSGALLGKLNNRVFLIGEEFDGAGMEAGKLFLRVNDAAWSGEATGEYDVSIE